MFGEVCFRASGYNCKVFLRRGFGIIKFKTGFRYKEVPFS